MDICFIRYLVSKQLYLCNIDNNINYFQAILGLRDRCLLLLQCYYNDAENE